MNIYSFLTKKASEGIILHDAECFLRILRNSTKIYFASVLKEFYAAGYCQSADILYLQNIYDESSKQINQFWDGDLEDKKQELKNCIKALLDFFKQNCVRQNDGTIHIMDMDEDAIMVQFRELIDDSVNVYSEFEVLAQTIIKTQYKEYYESQSE